MNSKKKITKTTRPPKRIGGTWDEWWPKKYPTDKGSRRSGGSWDDKDKGGA